MSKREWKLFGILLNRNFPPWKNKWKRSSKGVNKLIAPNHIKVSKTG